VKSEVNFVDAQSIFNVHLGVSMMLLHDNKSNFIEIRSGSIGVEASV
jgi:hypothetical protein